MKPMFKHKKGQLIGESIALFATTIVIAILLIVFFFLIKMTSGQAGNVEMANSFSLENQAGLSLKAYLATPVKINYDNEAVEVSMADLIRIAYLNESYKELLEKETREIFDKIYGREYNFEIKDLILIENVNEMIIQREIVSPTMVSSKVLLPNFEITLYLKLK